MEGVRKFNYGLETTNRGMKTCPEDLKAAGNDHHKVMLEALKNLRQGDAPLNQAQRRALAENRFRPCQSEKAVYPAARVPFGVSPMAQIPQMHQISLDDASQQQTAQKLMAVLDQLGFDQANQLVHPGSYGQASVFENDMTSEKLGQLLRGLQKNGKLTEKQALAIHFFMYGASLNLKRVNDLLGGDRKLLSDLMKNNIIIFHQGEYRVNDLSLISYALPTEPGKKPEVVYSFIDLPQKWGRLSKQDPTVEVNPSTFSLLQRMKEDKNGKHLQPSNYQGVMADFGAGSGILTYAGLKLHPGLKQALAIEIDPHAENLLRWNALMNGFNSDQVKVVHNDPLEDLGKVLGNQKIAYAVSNPPFTPMPDAIAEKYHYTQWANGGTTGLKVTKLFVNQALKHLKPGAPFIIYSQLTLRENPQTGQGKYFAEDMVAQASQKFGINTEIEFWHYGTFIHTRGYNLAMAQARLIVDHTEAKPNQRRELAKQIFEANQAAGVEGLETNIWIIRSQGNADGPATTTSVDVEGVLTNHEGKIFQNGEEISKQRPIQTSAARVISSGL